MPLASLATSQVRPCLAALIASVARLNSGRARWQRGPPTHPQFGPIQSFSQSRRASQSCPGDENRARRGFINPVGAGTQRASLTGRTLRGRKSCNFTENSHIETPFFTKTKQNSGPCLTLGLGALWN
jgi:hypothetical protein